MMEKAFSDQGKIQGVNLPKLDAYDLKEILHDIIILTVRYLKKAGFITPEEEQAPRNTDGPHVAGSPRHAKTPGRVAQNPKLRPPNSPRFWSRRRRTCAEEPPVLCPKRLYDPRRTRSQSTPLDPDLDSYYVMDTVLIALPSFQFRLSQFATDLMIDAKTGKLTPDRILQLKINAALINEDLQHLKSSMTTAVAEDKNFYGLSDDLQGQIPKVIDRFVDQTSTLLNNFSSIDLTSEGQIDAFIAQSQPILESSFTIWHVLAVEPDSLLQARIDHHASQRLNYLITEL